MTDIEKLIEYITEHEEEDFLEQKALGENVDNHIFMIAITASYELENLQYKIDRAKGIAAELERELT